MTHDLFRTDAYLRSCPATVTAITGQGIVLDRTVFYPLGGGQAGDRGEFVLADGSVLAIADTRKGTEPGTIARSTSSSSRWREPVDPRPSRYADTSGKA